MAEITELREEHRENIKTVIPVCSKRESRIQTWIPDQVRDDEKHFLCETQSLSLCTLWLSLTFDLVVIYSTVTLFAKFRG
jgi:hypothetical protein